MKHEFIQLDIAGPVATVWLNRPAQRNALNRGMCLELSAVLRDIEVDESLAVLLVRARGPVFCAGADLAERKQMSAEQVRERRLLAFDCYDALETLPKPCIAVVEGAAVGAGVEIATACDFVWATDRASFRYPEVAWGTVGATQRLPEVVGKRMAKELLFTGRTVDSQEAFRLGLANRIVPAGEIESALAATTDALSGAPRNAMRLAKQCVNARFDEARRFALTTEINAIDELLASPSWKGRLEEFGRPS